METIRFVRIILIFDLPVETKMQQKSYRQFIKFLKNEGFIRIQYSVYSKLCINKDSAKTESKRISMNAPIEGDIRYLIVSENQYQNIINLNNKHSLQESVTTTDRTLVIGGLNDED
ncbi:CRISPR-associated endonuclease Cas2 [Floccifex sp.]|uniref:CRISPR-associated endonuclease Cas2 n=1 Tax=Floccifex sp. TaxID=2815810 RepID=UPI002A76283D|nr:CRISPR-associated endonuclease Cas2 [Floccifex sp.]MDD7280619.1 CRISPR-associated endonuclease Cas2 [Erysipelotrichaceae bacterium]MDY2958853.1 CRISPR-associated endonuclease Cas2 [Floccifex sp.]